MPIFRRRRDPHSTPDSPVLGPDGTEYVPVDASVAHEMAVMLCDRAVANVERPVAAGIDGLLARVFDDIVLFMRGEDVSDPPKALRSLAYTAAKLGFAARASEFDFLEQDSSNDVLTDFMAHVLARGQQAQSWSGSVAVAASTLMNASWKSPDDAAAAAYLAPVGCGHEMHSQMFAILTGSLLGIENGELRAVPGLDVAEVGVCMRYGYYVHACLAALPAEALSELGAT